MLYNTDNREISYTVLVILILSIDMVILLYMKERYIKKKTFTSREVGIKLHNFEHITDI